jgi:hypothetical protein
MLPLELALRLLPGRALALEGSLGLLEGGLLLLEMSLHLLMCTLLLAELLPHRSKRRNLVRKVSPQPFDLLGFLLDLGLPRPCPLEGGEVLLELSLHHGKGRLPLCHCILQLSQGRTHLLQRIVPLQECMSTAEAPSAVWEPWSRSASRTARSRYSSQPLSVCRASMRASRVSYWLRYQSSSVLN